MIASNAPAMPRLSPREAWCIINGPMLNLFSILAFGFWLGVRHATDGDHVAAVSTLVSRNKKTGTAWLLGAFWGLGHSLTIFLAGAVIIFLKLEVPPRVGLTLEFGVGLLLMGLGALNMAGYRLGGGKVQAHSHAHDPQSAHISRGTCRHAPQCVQRWNRNSRCLHQS